VALPFETLHPAGEELVLAIDGAPVALTVTEAVLVHPLESVTVTT
jgi:hypothetical protein